VTHMCSYKHLSSNEAGKFCTKWKVAWTKTMWNYFSLYDRHPLHVKWVQCHHGMARPRVADRGDCLQIWRVAANIFNKQSRIANSGWSSSFGVGRGANNPPPQNSIFVTKHYAQSRNRN
jgi:hypothetical protein